MAVGFATYDPGQLGGPLHANDTGWDWYFICAFRDMATNSKTFGVPVVASTLDADTPAQIQVKQAAAVKAEGANRGYNVTVVALPPFALLSV